MIFNHLIKHASFGGGTDRRMFVINCSERVPAEVEQELHVIEQLVQAHAAYGLKSMYTTTHFSLFLTHWPPACCLHLPSLQQLNACANYGLKPIHHYCSHLNTADQILMTRFLASWELLQV